MVGISNSRKPTKITKVVMLGELADTAMIPATMADIKNFADQVRNLLQFVAGQALSAVKAALSDELAVEQADLTVSNASLMQNPAVYGRAAIRRTQVTAQLNKSRQAAILARARYERLMVAYGFLGSAMAASTLKDASAFASKAISALATSVPLDIPTNILQPEILRNIPNVGPLSMQARTGTITEQEQAAINKSGIDPSVQEAQNRAYAEIQPAAGASVPGLSGLGYGDDAFDKIASTISAAQEAAKKVQQYTSDLGDLGCTDWTRPGACNAAGDARSTPLDNAKIESYCRDFPAKCPAGQPTSLSVQSAWCALKGDPLLTGKACFGTSNAPQPSYSSGIKDGYLPDGSSASWDQIVNDLRAANAGGVAGAINNPCAGLTGTLLSVCQNSLAPAAAAAGLFTGGAAPSYPGAPGGSSGLPGYTSAGILSGGLSGTMLTVLAGGAVVAAVVVSQQLKKRKSRSNGKE